MMPRREFSKAVKAQIVKRAMLPSGEIACENCGLVLGRKPYQIDHTIADALILDKSRPLTADDGKLLGKDCCHDPKTRQHDVPAIAKAKRREAKDLGIVDPPKMQGRKFPRTSKSARREANASKKPSLPPKPLYTRHIEERNAR